jgi:hypothetical protein
MSAVSTRRTTALAAVAWLAAEATASFAAPRDMGRFARPGARLEAEAPGARGGRHAPPDAVDPQPS